MACMMNIYDLYEGINKLYRRPTVYALYMHIYAPDVDLYVRYILYVAYRLHIVAYMQHIGSFLVGWPIKTKNAIQ